jgi:short-subunit dehydrogenase
MPQLHSKIIWITGASSGIGKELAMQLASQRNRLVLSARNVEALKEISLQCESRGSETLVLPLDLENSAAFAPAVEEVIKRFGGIDILINNGGISQRSLAAETPIEIDRKMMEINYFGTVGLTKTVLPVMLRQKRGQIAVISSLSGKFGWAQRSAYAAAKHALQGFFETLHIEMQSHGIDVNIVCPGRVNTPISLSALTKDGTAHGVKDAGQEKGIPVEVCVRKIIQGLEAHKPEIIIARSERVVYLIHSISKKWFYWLAAKVNPNN